MSLIKILMVRGINMNYLFLHSDKIQNLLGNDTFIVKYIFSTGLYSLTHLVLDNNLIKSMVSAAFRHIPQLEKLSLRHNLIEGNLSYNVTSIIINA